MLRSRSDRERRARRANGQPAEIPIVALVLLLTLVIPAGAARVALHGPGHSSGRTYYVADAAETRCSDDWDARSASEPWCDLRPIDRHRLSPGDRLLLVCGGIWKQPAEPRTRPYLSLSGRGTARNPVVLSTYRAGYTGESACAVPPHLIGAGADAEVVRIINPDHWRLEGWELSDGAVGLRIHFTSVGHRSVILRHLVVHDFKGVFRGDCRRWPGVYTAIGVLFDHSADLLPRAPTSILSAVEISDFEGYHNQASLGLAGYGCSAGSPTSSNLYQQVLLERLDLHDDAGPAPACSDGLQLVSISHVRVLDSRFAREGGCRTSSGTTAVILGQVNEVAFVNDVFEETRNTGSPDQTGVDLENFTRRVRVLGSYFGGNAGPGLEILTINGSRNYHDALAVEGDVFVDNATAVAAGIDQSSHVWRGGDGIQPTGRITDNLYSGSIPLVGGRLPDVNQERNVRVRGKVYLASWGSADGWSVRFTNTSGGWRWADVAVTCGAPALLLPGAPRSCSASRDWTAPRTGTISIRAYVTRADVGPAARLTATVSLAGRVLLPPTQIGAGVLATNLDAVHVRRGDVVRFEVRSPRIAEISWAPAIGYTG